jgi:hypothetical protein
MSAQVAVFYLLNNNAATTGAVGGRLFYDTAPQKNIRPLLVVSLVSQVPNNTLGIGGDSKLDICRVQVTIAAATRLQCSEIATLVRDVLKDVYNQTLNGVNVNWCRFDSSVDYFDDFSGEDGIFVTQQDYKLSITIANTTPTPEVAYCDTMEGVCNEIEYECNEEWFN